MGGKLKYPNMFYKQLVKNHSSLIIFKFYELLVTNAYFSKKIRQVLIISKSSIAINTKSSLTKLEQLFLWEEIVCCWHGDCGSEIPNSTETRFLFFSPKFSGVNLFFEYESTNFFYQKDLCWFSHNRETNALKYLNN